MDIVKIGKRLEIGEEIELKVIAGGRVFRMMCSPNDLEELLIGFSISEGLSENPEVYVEGDVGVIENVKETILSINSSGCIGIYVDENIGRVFPKREFKIDQVLSSLRVIETELYRRTRAYHTAAVINERIYCSYDVGRHNAVDKAIGKAYKNGVDFSESYLVLSGRITKGIALKCVRAGIPLVVSKAAILNSAIEVCEKSGLSAVSLASGIAVNNGAIDL